MMAKQYAVGSHTPGDYQIPAINVTVDGQKLVTQPLKLKVLAAGAGQPPAWVPPNAGRPQPSAEGEGDGGKRFGFLTVSGVAKDRKYVHAGEIRAGSVPAHSMPNSSWIFSSEMPFVSGITSSTQTNWPTMHSA